MTTELATRPIQATEQSAPMRLLAIEQVYDLASRVAKSGLMGKNRSPEEVFTLMMLCEADQIHYMEALRRYDIIEGTPSLKSAVALAEYQRRGGRVKWIHSDDDSVEAIFSHRTLHPEPFVVKFSLQRFIDRKIAMTWDQARNDWRMKREWSKNPAALLRARAITAGVRAIDPGVFAGVDSIDDAEDRGPVEDEIAPAHARVIEDAQVALRVADIALPRDPSTGPDRRPYTALVQDLSEFLRYDKWAIHEHLWARAAQTDQAETLGGRPKTRKEVIERMRRLYDRDRAFVRRELAAYTELRREVHEPGVLDDAVSTEVQPPSGVTSGRDLASLFPEIAARDSPAAREGSENDLDPDADYPPEPGANG